MVVCYAFIKMSCLKYYTLHFPVILVVSLLLIA
jgi:hypothetical protein